MDQQLERFVETERKRREHAAPPTSSKPGAAAVTNDWRASVESADEYMALFDLDLNITFMNRLQAGVPDVVGLHALTCIEPSEHEAFLQATAAAYVTGLPHYYETRGTGPNGRPVVYRSWVLPLFGRGGPASFASVNVDITHLGRVQRELEEQTRRAAEEHRVLEAQLAQAQKMQALGQLTGGIAHDFNNLLTVIVGSLSLLKGSSSKERTRELMGHAEEAAARAAALTQRLLAFARRQPLRPQAIELRALLAGMEQLLRRTLPADIELFLEVEPTTWLCRADPVQLESAVLNLVINARDAMPKGGTLRISVANARIGPKSPGEQGGLASGDYVLIDVTDTGTGMAPDVLAQAFEPFFTTKGVGRGSGLGLSMVYGFASQSGGEARIFSHPGSGTTVRLYLPRSTTGVSTTTLQTQGVQGDGAGRLVLVVEDDAAVRRVVCEMLGRIGYQTIAAADGASAQHLLASREDVALLLIDMMLPGGMSGPELVNAIRGDYSHLPVLFMTGYSDEAVSNDPAIHGVKLLTKPFTESALAAAVLETLSEAAHA